MPLHPVRVSAALCTFLRVHLVRMLLLIGLMLAATVPEGMMRANGPDGLQMVLCTVDGPRDMVLLPDGTLSEVPVTQGDAGGGCIAVIAAFDGVQDRSLPTPSAIAFPNPLAVNTDDVATHLVRILAFASRGPPKLV